ncbi:MAG: Ig-like domain-containing protein [Candidatus Thiodiazotropha sp. (ex Codakia rugifera)]|nr:Ig-like domain-containing protein [Candidatus Thiodiazotropha sp. (ex Codakia rugifera)]
MIINKNKICIGILALLAVGLSACGGGSSSADSSTNNTDQGASQGDSQQDSSPPADDNPPPGDNPPADNPPPDTTPPVEENINQQPTARISTSQQVTSGETVTLDGSGSTDPDGDTLSFLWSQTLGESISLGGVSNPSLSFIAPTVDQPTTFAFQLEISDGALSNSATVEILVSPMADTTAPSVVSRTPQSNETGVVTTTNVTLTFDEALLESLINNQSLQISLNSNTLSGSVTYDSDNHRITLTPDTTLTAATTYTVTLSDTLQDLAGNPVTGESWSFTTGSQYNLGQTSQGTIDLCMNTSNKVMLTLVNNARAVTRACGTTSYPATSSLAWHCNLEQAAQGHSTSMADNNFFSHTGLDDSSPGDRITAAGYNWRTYGENIAAGYADEETAMNAWLNSPGHCANLMNPNFTEMGEAVAENPDSQYRIYWTQNFADSF